MKVNSWSNSFKYLCHFLESEMSSLCQLAYSRFVQMSTSMSNSMNKNLLWYASAPSDRIVLVY